jgi:hypothetical protein
MANVRIWGVGHLLNQTPQIQQAEAFDWIVDLIF